MEKWTETLRQTGLYFIHSVEPIDNKRQMPVSPGKMLASQSLIRVKRRASPKPQLTFWRWNEAMAGCVWVFLRETLTTAKGYWATRAGQSWVFGIKTQCIITKSFKTESGKVKREEITFLWSSLGSKGIRLFLRIIQVCVAVWGCLLLKLMRQTKLEIKIQFLRTAKKIFTKKCQPCMSSFDRLATNNFFFLCWDLTNTKQLYHELSHQSIRLNSYIYICYLHVEHICILKNCTGQQHNAELTQPFVYFIPSLLQYLSSFIFVFTSFRHEQDRREEDRTMGKWREQRHRTGGRRGSAKTDMMRPVSCARNGKSQPVDESRDLLCAR